MIEILRWLGILIGAAVRERRDLALENLALRQQLGVLKRRKGVPRLRRKDRWFWVVLSGIWTPWRRVLAPGQRGHRRGLATDGLQNVLGQSFAAKEWRSPASEFRAQSVNQADGGR